MSYCEKTKKMNNFIVPISALLFLLLALDTTATPPTGQIKGKLNIVESSSYYDRIEGNGYLSNRIVSTFSADLNFPNDDDAKKRIDVVIRNAVNAMAIENHRLHCKVNYGSETFAFCDTLSKLPIEIEIANGKVDGLNEQEMEKALENAVNRELAQDGTNWRITLRFR
jgi:hypothetical protein